LGITALVEISVIIVPAMTAMAAVKSTTLAAELLRARSLGGAGRMKTTPSPHHQTTTELLTVPVCLTPLGVGITPLAVPRRGGVGIPLTPVEEAGEEVGSDP